jgi:glycine/D-amino acid oxidase-like deaminating enzyme/nitrite reductase/ring-hydroxylating ferredoxin subunit
LTTSARQSLWLDEPPGASYPPLGGREIEADVAIVGGGITGLTTALLLKRAGLRVAVLEARTVGSGVTGCTTAKVSALQSTILSTIASHHGPGAVAVYAEASAAAVERVAALADEEGIACDLERRAAYTFAAQESEVGSVQGELDAAAGAGLPVTADAPDLPFAVEASVCLPGQVQLHPVRYVRGLAAAVDGDGSRVLEHTRALSADAGDPWTIRAGEGAVRARHVVVATHYPLLDRGLYFARLEPQRSYCIAVRLRETPPQGMAISAGSPTRSLRAYGDLLVVGGEGHAPGGSEATPERFERLEEYARRHWDVAAVTHRWSAQDPSTYDQLPVIGPYAPRASRLWVASGFMKWGLSSGTFAAMILADLIQGRDHPWAATFAPARLSVRSTPEIAKLGAKFSWDFVWDRLKPAQAGSGGDVPAGEARVVRDGLGRTGVFRDDDGALHAVSLRCTHLGCLLRWNGAERSWDCPCHGSRFDVDGGVLEGPAVQPLARRPPSGD